MFNLSNFYNTDSLKRFHVPTCLLEGEGCRTLVGELVDMDQPGVLVVDAFFQEHPFVRELMERTSSPLQVVSGEPRTDAVDAFLAKRPAEVSWVVGLGGGSTLDTAKAILASVLFGEYRRVGYGDLRNAGETFTGAKPRFVAIPTTAGSGSETSRYYLVSDATTGVKQVSRTWRVCPDFALLDPILLSQAPRTILVAGAFDTFVHHWETFVCRYEASPLVQGLSLEGMASTILSLQELQRQPEPALTSLQALQRASALGGMALSNVRSGLLHTAGEALAKNVPIPHPQTLMVFLEETFRSYEREVEPRAECLLGRLPAEFRTVRDLARFWTGQFAQAGLLADIGRSLQTHVLDASGIVASVLADQVLVSKEHPSALDAARVEALVAASLARAKTWAP